MASSSTCRGERPVRSFSRTDCCAKMGAMRNLRTDRTWPGVANPNRSPNPAERASPSGRASRWGNTVRSQSARRGSAGALLTRSGTPSQSMLASGPSKAAGLPAWATPSCFDPA